MKIEKEEIHGLIAAFVALLLILAVLWWVRIAVPEEQEESGVPIMLGVETLPVKGQGGEIKPVTPLTGTEVKAEEQVQEETTAIPKVTSTQKSKLIAQEDPSPMVEEEKKSTEQQELDEKKRREEALRKRQEEEKRRQEEIARKKREEAAKRMAAVSNAFKQSQAMKSGEETGKKSTNQGSLHGTNQGVIPKGYDGQTSYNLPGRHTGREGLPKPARVPGLDEGGTVIVQILVSPEGRVISARVQGGTVSGNAQARRSAENAARKAHFNAVKGVDNQQGTITYVFKLR